jgi:hypothetical protein
LSLHLSFFAFTECQQDEAPPTGWVDISVLKNGGDSASRLRMSTIGVCKTRFSLVICGTNEQHWTGYCFVDRDLEKNELDEELSGHDQFMTQEDPIASDNGERSINAESPIKDPRAYFLTIFEIRIAAVKREWEGLVRAMERGIEDRVSLFGTFSFRRRCCC